MASYPKNPWRVMAPIDLHETQDWTPGRWRLFDPFMKMGLPAMGGVYVFFIDGEPVYLGQTSNLRIRLAAYRFEFGWAANIYTPWGCLSAPTTVYGKLRVSRRYGDWAMHELRLLKALKPRFNKRQTYRIAEERSAA